MASWCAKSSNHTIKLTARKLAIYASVSAIVTVSSIACTEGSRQLILCSVAFGSSAKDVPAVRFADYSRTWKGTMALSCGVPHLPSCCVRAPAPGGFAIALPLPGMWSPVRTQNASGPFRPGCPHSDHRRNRVSDTSDAVVRPALMLTQTADPAMQLTVSKPAVWAFSVCRRASLLRNMHRGLAAAEFVGR